MTSDELKRIAVGLAQLASICDTDWSEIKFKAYSSALADYDFEPVARGLHSLIKTHKPNYRGHMPSPAEILESAGITGQQAVDTAWQEVLQALKTEGRYANLKFERDAITASIRSAGGWLKLCNSDDKSRVWFKKAFDAAYAQYSVGEIPEEMTRPLAGERGSKNMLVSASGEVKALAAAKMDPRLAALTGKVGGENV